MLIFIPDVNQLFLVQIRKLCFLFHQKCRFHAGVISMSVNTYFALQAIVFGRPGKKCLGMGRNNKMLENDVSKGIIF